MEPNPAPPVLLLDAANERSAVEQQVGVVKVLATLSQGSTIDLPLTMLTYNTEWAKGDQAVLGLTASEMLRYLACRLIWSRSGRDLTRTLACGWPIDAAATERSSGTWWERMAMFLWAWDEAIRDQFATQTFGTASSYELGRGLAESYWSLLPTKGPAYDWGFLLGPERVKALCDDSRRLAPIIGTLTARAVESTIRSWGEVAKDPGNYVDPHKKLKSQALVWRDLLVTGRDPLTMVAPHKLERRARQPWPLVRAFGWEIGAMLAGALLIGLGSAYFSKFSATFLTVLGAVGITASAAIGWAKNKVQKVAQRVQDSVNLDVVVKTVLCYPEQSGQHAPVAPAGASPSVPPPSAPAPGARAA
jgi:hypothetical protein